MMSQICEIIPWHFILFHLDFRHTLSIRLFCHSMYIRNLISIYKSLQIAKWKALRIIDLLANVTMTADKKHFIILMYLIFVLIFFTCDKSDYFDTFTIFSLNTVNNPKILTNSLKYFYFHRFLFWTTCAIFHYFCQCMTECWRILSICPTQSTNRPGRFHRRGT